MDSDTDRLLVPYDEARRKLGDIGRTTMYELFDRGELVRVNIGRRGFVTAKSIAAYVDRLSQAASVGVA
ncbi:helix-turn-helix domain-containing protein [Mycobacterium sp. SMC-2]|uniref:helix-turn-helix domain-containing protein n=1 Tax=Mycobacterium sp. SMC-2 TaxID=2857058 RepID=UPI0021B39A5F|nr:helix-turn-helix domain-containing protein [Mycobacterium sp. SMC-2]UXA04419.1 helix-turn-helix domain-containing protein [Mycobacterium sp. SMC-2]